jgi:hypothetical protein
VATIQIGVAKRFVFVATMWGSVAKIKVGTAPIQLRTAPIQHFATPFSATVATFQPPEAPTWLSRPTLQERVGSPRLSEAKILPAAPATHLAAARPSLTAAPIPAHRAGNWERASTLQLHASPLLLGASPSSLRRPPRNLRRRAIQLLKAPRGVVDRPSRVVAPAGNRRDSIARVYAAARSLRATALAALQAAPSSLRPSPRASACGLRWAPFSRPVGPVRSEPAAESAPVDGDSCCTSYRDRSERIRHDGLLANQSRARSLAVQPGVARSRASTNHTTSYRGRERHTLDRICGTMGQAKSLREEPDAGGKPLQEASEEFGRRGEFVPHARIGRRIAPLK